METVWRVKLSMEIFLIKLDYDYTVQFNDCNSNQFYSMSIVSDRFETKTDLARIERIAQVDRIV